MGETCYLCGSKLSWRTGTGMTIKLLREAKQTPPKDMTENDRMCGDCFNKDIGSHELQEREDEILKQSTGESSTNSPIGMSSISTTPLTKTNISSTLPKSSPPNLSNSTSAEQLRSLTKTLHDQTKANWDKNGVVQFKSESLAILQRMWGQQVQFIVACDQLTKEGYRLMAIDEGKSGGQASGGFTGGVNAYFYFQKMDFVK